MKRYIITLCTLIAFLFSCEDPYENDTYMAYDEYPTATYLDSRADDFSLWIELLHYTDLYNAINQASRTFTCFVPDNDAMTTFLKSKNVSSVEELDKSYATQLVKYHLIEDEISQKKLLVGGKLTTQTVSEDYLTISFGEGGGVNSVYINDEAKITELAIETTNGLVYVLDAVLTPLVETLYNRLEENDSYSIFQNAAELTGLDEKLNTTYDTIVSESTGKKSVTKQTYTMFVVPDDVYAAKSISDVNGLASYLGASSNYTDTTNALYQYVSYHLLSQTRYIEDLYPEDDEDSTTIWTTQATNQVLSTNTVNGVKYLNYTSASESGVPLGSNTDKIAKNGIYHEVESIMPVFSPDPITIIWDVCDYSDVASVVNAYGADNDLGDIYQTIQSKEYKVTFSEDEVTSYTWTAYSSASTSSYPQMGYLVTKAGDSGNTYGAYLNDMLYVNLGYAGHVTMTTPVVLKGKYKIELYYACAGSLKEFISGGSKCSFSFDDETNEVYVYDGAQASVGIYTLTMFDEIEFDTTSDHAFKIVLLDSRATTNSVYRLQLDYVKFIPLTD